MAVERRWQLGWAAILVLALALRVGWIAHTPDYRLCCDAKDYDRYAVSLAHGDGFPQFTLSAAGGPTAFRPPLYPLTLGAAYAVSGRTDSDDRLTVARCWGALLGTLAVALIGLLAWRLAGDRRTATIAMALAAVYPPLVFYSASVLTEALFLPVEVGALLAVLRYLRAPPGRRRTTWLVAAGGLAGLGALTRPNGFILALALALGVLPALPWRSPRVLAAPLLVAGAFFLAVIPWVVRNEIEVDAPVLNTSTGFALAGTYNDEAAHASKYPASWIFPPQAGRLLAKAPTEAEFDRQLRDDAIDYAIDDPAYPLKVAYWNTIRILDLDPSFSSFIWGLDPDVLPRWTDVARYAFYLVFLLALGSLAIKRVRQFPAVVWWMIGLFFFSTIFFWGPSRYRQPLEPFLVVLAAISLTRLLDLVLAHRRREPAR